MIVESVEIERRYSIAGKGFQSDTIVTDRNIAFLRSSFRESDRSGIYQENTVFVSEHGYMSMTGEKDIAFFEQRRQTVRRIYMSVSEEKVFPESRNDVMV